MAIINFLPEFKLVEINRSTGLVMGHVLAQFPLDPGFAGIIDDYEYDMVENGFIMGLGSDLEVDEYDPARHAQPFLLFTEELNTFFDGLKWYATGADEQDGIIYPRLVGLYPGDSFTTNNFEGEYTNQKFAKVINGQLSLQNVANEFTLFAVEESTLPTGDLGLRFTYIGGSPEAEASGPQTTTTTVAPTTTTSTTEAPLSSDAEILTFTFNVQDEIVDIDDENDEVNVIVPDGTGVMALTAVFTLSAGAASEPESPYLSDFDSPVAINVIAEDETERIWTVSVTEADPL